MKTKTISGINAEGKLYTQKKDKNEWNKTTQSTTTTNIKQIADSSSNKTNSEKNSLSMKIKKADSKK